MNLGHYLHEIVLFENVLSYKFPQSIYFLVRKIVFELINCTFEEARLVAICGLLALNDFLAALVFFYFFETDDVQEFRIKVAVETVAVVCERLREEGFWGKEFVEREERCGV